MSQELCHFSHCMVTPSTKLLTHFKTPPQRNTSPHAWFYAGKALWAEGGGQEVGSGLLCLLSKGRLFFLLPLQASLGLLRVGTVKRKSKGREVFLQAHGIQDCTVAWPPGWYIIFFLWWGGLTLLLLPVPGKVSFPFQFQIIPQSLFIWWPPSTSENHITLSEVCLAIFQSPFGQNSSHLRNQFFVTFHLLHFLIASCYPKTRFFSWWMLSQ